MYNTKAILTYTILLIGMNLNAQQIDFNSLTKNLLLEKQIEWSLDDEDIKEYVITDRYTSKHNGVTHIFVKQKYNGTSVFNAITSFNIKDGKLLISTNNFVTQLKSKVNKTSPTLSHEEALISLTKSLDIKYDELPALKKSLNSKEFIYKKASFTKTEIPVNLVYYPDRQGNVHLAWNIELQMNTSPDYWNALVDAKSGKLLHNYNQTLYCKFDHNAFGKERKCIDHNHNHNHNHQNQLSTSKNKSISSATDGATYRVFPFPVESPIHGNQALVESPSFEFASQFGWHDTDGVKGPEYTTTRGNNVHAYEDSNDTNNSQNNEPDGGEDLRFDFPLDLLAEPDSIMESVVTNLFYASNYVHDWAYYYGLDEQAGNFQVNNYGRGGRDNDEVQANGLDGEDVGNANFSLTRDGTKSFLQMYKWSGAAGTNFININQPEEISGPLETGSCSFCPAISTTALTGKVVVTEDFAGNRGDACEELVNAEAVSGNIALVDRGSCFFVDKVFNAQEAGAIAVIVCNFENGLVQMGPGPNETRDFTIPGLFLERRDCDAIKASIAAGDEVGLTFQAVTPTNDGPSQLAGSYDNGIVAHEYGHGISSRLTGGPSNICLFNDEEMGEGWSDFVALVLTHEPGDSGDDRRGIGNYVSTNDPVGRGIRRRPYSTDFAINPHTYNSIRSSSLSPHNLGEVWTTMLWDLYWEFIEVYGFNADWTDKESGNYKAVQLVFDGMKLQGCSPGFVRGRNGILAADEVLFDGEHQCMIWEVFAKRGLGFFADEGSSNNRNDNQENFDVFPQCIQEVKIEKEMTEIIDAGNDIKVEILVTNHKSEEITGTIVTDVIPAGASYKVGSSNIPAIVSGNVITFELGTMTSLEGLEIQYVLETDIEKSAAILVDDFESSSSVLTGFPLKQGLKEWQFTEVDAFRGTRSYFVPNDTTDLDQGLITIQTQRIEGERPTLSFRHNYDTEYYFDGGIVEISTDFGDRFDPIPNELFLKGGYDTELDYSTFAIPNVMGFTGDSDGWKVSYIDLSDYKGEDILVRFRFGCDDADIEADPDNPNARVNEIPRPNTGWYIDNFEIVDLSFIDGNDAMVTTNEGDMATAGDITVINTEFTTPTKEITEDHNFLVFPNPAQNRIYVNFKSEETGIGSLQLIDLNGRLVSRNTIDIRNINSHSLQLNSVPAGMYLVQVVAKDFVLSSKVVVEN